MRGRIGIVLLAGVMTAPAAASAQELGGEAGPTRWSVSGGFVVAQPVGEFSEHVGAGFGASVQALLRLDRAGVLSLRGDAGFVNYGNETRRMCFSATVGCRIQLDLRTSNNIGFVSVGPHLEAPLRAVRPFVHAGVGGTYFATMSSVRGTDRSDNIARTTNFDDLTFGWLAGGGINVPVRRGVSPIHVQLAARYHGNGRAEYLREGDIEDHPDGSITMRPTRSEANLITYQIGVSAVIGRSR
jgi:hypothetical protein